MFLSIAWFWSVEGLLLSCFLMLGAGPLVELLHDTFVKPYFFQGYEFELQLLCIEIYYCTLLNHHHPTHASSVTDSLQSKKIHYNTKHTGTLIHKEPTWCLLIVLSLLGLSWQLGEGSVMAPKQQLLKAWGPNKSEDHPQVLRCLQDTYSNLLALMNPLKLGILMQLIQ